MKKVGETVEVLSLRPGERLYAHTFTIAARSERQLVLESLEVRTEINVVESVGSSELHDDQLLGPPLVESRDIIKDPIRGTCEDLYRAYYYEVNDTIILSLI